MTLIFVSGKIFLVHTEGTCLTHELQDEMPDFSDDDIEVVPPRTIIIDISGDLSGQEISSSVLAHELAHAVFPRSVYHIEVRISSGNRSQILIVEINRDETYQADTFEDGTFQRNIVIGETRIVPPLSDDDDGHVVFHAVVLDNTDTEQEKQEPTVEVVGSIRFDAVLTSSI